MAAAEERGLALALPDAFEARSGRGIVGKVSGRTVALGNAALLEELGIDAGALAERADAMRAEGQTAVFLAVDGAPAGALGVADPIKTSTLEAVRQLHADGLRLVMLTGDNVATAQAVAAKLGIDEVIADVLPERKAQVVKELQAGGHVVATAGDGINDAPALAQAASGSRWAPAPTSRSRALASRS
jgi:Cu+-exporting ATPase